MRERKREREGYNYQVHFGGCFFFIVFIIKGLVN